MDKARSGRATLAEYISDRNNISFGLAYIQIRNLSDSQIYAKLEAAGYKWNGTVWI